MPQPVCLVVGVGPGNGAAIARRFAADGYSVGLVARTEEFSRAVVREIGPAGRFHAADAGDPSALRAAMASLQRDLGDADVLVHNAGSGEWGTVEEVTPAAFEWAWRVNALGALVASQHVLPAMRRKGQGTIVFIGATASRRGGPRSAAFSSAKGAQRHLAESMARQLWPAGIHVALVMIDGVVDLPRTRQRMPDKPDAFFVRPTDVAAAVASIVRQPRSAWSFEVEVRPFGEAW
jgi:NAD(P)-dependent dehydrogenase (short-subunit alcohol dehydrogenase family)